MARFVFLNGLAIASALGYPKALVRIIWRDVKDPANGLFMAMTEDETIGLVLCRELRQ